MRAIVFVAVVLAMGTTADAAVLRLLLNHSTQLHLSGQASSVVVGNPLIADATVVDSRTVFVSGRNMGSTDVVVMDALGRTIYRGDVAVGPSGAAVTVFQGGGGSLALACAPTCQSADADTTKSLTPTSAPAMIPASGPPAVSAYSR